MRRPSVGALVSVLVNIAQRVQHHKVATETDREAFSESRDKDSEIS